MMTVMCQIVRPDKGYEGVVEDSKTGQTVYNTGFQRCAEDAEGLMEGIILRNNWEVVFNPVNERWQ